MRAFIDSVDGRKTTFYDRLKPHMSKPVDIDGLIGIYNFTLTKLTNPTMEFLDTLDNIGKGHFEIMYNVYQIPELQFTPDFGKYQIFFKDGNRLLEYKEYLRQKGAKYYFVDESYFIVIPKEETILTTGTVIISTGNDVVRFIDTPSPTALHLFENLYMEMSLKHIEVFSENKALDAYKLCLGDLEVGTGVKVGNTISNKTAIIEVVSPNDILSSIGVIVYERDGKKGFEFRNLTYASWNQTSAVLDIKALEDEIGAGTTVTKLLVLYNTANDDKEDLDTLYEDFIYSCAYSPELEGFVKGSRASLLPIANDDPRLLVDFGNDTEYFSSIKSISKQFALSMIGDEYTRIRNAAELVEDGDNYVVFVPNRYSQVVSLYVNGKYFHTGFKRDDRLGVSKITIPKVLLKDYADKDEIEAVVEPLFTRRYDLVVDKVIKYGKAEGHLIEDELNLIPLYETAGLDRSMHLFIDGHFIRSDFYEIINYNNNLFIFFKKKVADIANVTVIVHVEDVYDEKVGTITDISKKEYINDYSKTYYGGHLISTYKLMNMLEGNYLGAAINPVFPDSHDDNLFICELKDNKLYKFVDGGSEDFLLRGFYYVDSTAKKVVVYTIAQIYTYIKNKVSPNTILINSYPTSNHEDLIVKRTKFAYDMLAIGKRFRGIVNGNDINGTGVKDYVKTNYSEFIDSEGRVIISNNEKVIAQAPVNVNFDRYED